MIASDGSWCGFAARARVLIVNTDLIKNPHDYPTSVAELADPKVGQAVRDGEAAIRNDRNAFRGASRASGTTGETIDQLNRFVTTR